MARKGIILAGGAGSRLHPLTTAVSKQLLPIYDKPMIYYPLSALMLAGVREIAVITTPDDQAAFRKLLGTGARFGVDFRFIVQPRPEGLAQAYLLAEDFLAGAPSVMVLGDNLFFGQGFEAVLGRAGARDQGATVFGYEVQDPTRYGVVSFDETGLVEDIEEKPAAPKSRFAVTGLYFYDGRASRFAKELAPSPRGELEITDLNRRYLHERALHVELLERGFAWLDTGTFDSLIEAGEFVRTIEHRQGLKIGCVEEIAFRRGWIDAAALRAAAGDNPNNPYSAYLLDVADGRASAGRPTDS